MTSVLAAAGCAGAERVRSLNGAGTERCQVVQTSDPSALLSPPFISRLVCRISALWSLGKYFFFLFSVWSHICLELDSRSTKINERVLLDC